MDNNKTDLEVICAMLDKADIGFVGQDNGNGMTLCLDDVYIVFDNDFMLVRVSDV